jgi:hypothetical protein
LESLYSDFAQEQTVNTAARKQAMLQELARLGVQQAGTGTFDQDAAFSANEAATANTGQQANLGAMRSMAGEVGDLLAGMATGSENAFLGQAMTTRNQSISQRNQDFNQYMADILGQANVLRSQEFVKTNDLSMQLQKSGMGTRGRKAKRRLLKQYATINKSGNNLNKLLGSVR